MTYEIEREEDLTGLRTSLARSTGVLAVRQIILRVVGFVGNVILARILAPEDFGVFAIAAFIITFFTMVGDVGLGASLIQKKGELTEDEIQTTFTVQQGGFTLFFIVIFFLAPLALRFYPDLPPGSEWLIRVMGLGLLLTSLRTVPTVLLEREMAYGKIAKIEVAQVLTYQVVAVTMAVLGFGIWSLVVASVLKGLAGVVLIFIFVRWKPRFRVNLEAARGLLRFGLPYQVGGMTGFVSSAIVPVVVGKFVGTAGVGFINWAKNLSHIPLFLAESYQRAAFPAMSKMQDDRAGLAESVVKSVNLLGVVMVPITLLMAALGPEIIKVIYTEKWMPGLHAYYVFLAVPPLIAFAAPMHTAILAVGDSKRLMVTSIATMAASWAAGVPLVLWLGFFGVAVAQSALVLAGTLIYYVILRKNGLKLDLAQLRLRHLFCALGAALAIYYSKSLVPANIITLTVSIIAGGLIYAALLYVFSKKQFMGVYELVEMKLLGRGARG